MSDDSYKFQKLTPFSDVELGVYKNAIDFVFANNEALLNKSNFC
ncbi:hypothetical protein [Escherichia coli]|nr:hypothetical protein [Escherichia coli]MCT7475440.1 hypothetical protein [Escherichia coli]WIF87416.1 hypothetical protein QN227_10685 [Escherichia coli]